MALMRGNCDCDLFQSVKIGPVSGVSVAGPIGKLMDRAVVDGGRQVSLHACQSTDANTLIVSSPEKSLGAVMLVEK